MDIAFLTTIVDNYQWQLSLYVALGIIAVNIVGKQLLMLVPACREIRDLNAEAVADRKARSYWMPVRKRSHFWGILTQVAIFVLVLPFCLTLESQPWWKILLEIFVILMFYDFFYYLVHRFLFHDGGFLGGPLVWVHAVHHQQKNPCRADASYLHPLEAMAGLALYGGSIAVLAALMGQFHVATIIITWVAFSEINQHNHDLQKTDHFPFKYLKYMSYMHHVHHSRFTSGNYATISLFYDWLFGTYDKGEGYGKNKEESKAA